jgi:hypothetical protein
MIIIARAASTFKMLRSFSEYRKIINPTKKISANIFLSYVNTWGNTSLKITRQTLIPPELYFWVLLSLIKLSPLFLKITHFVNKSLFKQFP